MILFNRFRPKLECLEAKLVLSGEVVDVSGPNPADDGGDTAAIVEDTSLDESDDILDPIDPTEDPVDESETIYMVEVLSVETYPDGQVQAITVPDAGFSDPFLATIHVESADGNSYLVDFTIINADGSYTFYFADAVPAGEFVAGDDVLIIFGDGSDDETESDTLEGSESEEPLP